MAIATLAAPLSGLRGTVAGLVYSANKSGPYVHSSYRSSNPRSTLQVEKRNVMGSLAKEWATLTGVQRTAWDTYAALPAQDLTNSLGETYSVSGFNWYIRINSQRILVGLASTVTVPALPRLAAPTLTSIQLRQTGAVLPSKVQITTGEFAGHYLILMGRLFFGSARAFTPNRHFFVISQISASPAFFPFQPELEAVFGDVVTGSQGFFTLQRQAVNGQRSPASVISDFVAAA